MLPTQTGNETFLWILVVTILIGFILTDDRPINLHAASSVQLQKDNEIYLNEPMQNVTKLKGERAKFLCDIIGQPIPKYSWFRNDSEQLDETSNGRIKIRQELWGSHLRIDNVQMEDEGKYTCEGKNEGGSVKTSAFLIVDSPKSINHESPLPKSTPQQPSSYHGVEVFHNVSGILKKGFCEPFRSDNLCKKYRTNAWVFVLDRHKQVELEAYIYSLIQETLLPMNENLNHYCLDFLMRRICLYHLPDCRPVTNTEQLNKMASKFQVMPLCQSECSATLETQCNSLVNIVQQLIDSKYFQLAYSCEALPNENCLLQNGLVFIRGDMTPSMNEYTANDTFNGRPSMNHFRSVIISVAALIILFVIISVLFCVWCLFQGHSNQRRVFTSNRALPNSCLCYLWPCASTHYQHIKRYTLNFSHRRASGTNHKETHPIFRYFRRSQPINDAKITTPMSSHATIHTAEMEPLCCCSEREHLGCVEKEKKHVMPTMLKEYPLSQIRLGEIFGHGKFGPVYYGELSTESSVIPVVVKAFFRNVSSEPTNSSSHGHSDDTIDKEVSKAFQFEATCHANLNHVNILSILGVSLRQNPQCMLYERSFYCDLHEFLLRHSKSSGDEVSECLLHHNAQLYLTSQIATGLHYLHSHGLIHRDVAARNVLLNERWQCKISDLGAAQEKYDLDYIILLASSSVSPSIPIQNPRTARRIPLRWSSPEVIFHGEYSFSSDIWSFGIVLWEVWSQGERPYECYSNEELMHQLKHTKLLLSKPETCVYEEIYRMMVECWSDNPQCRPITSVLISRLNELKDEALLTCLTPHRMEAPMGSGLQMSSPLLIPSSKPMGTPPFTFHPSSQTTPFHEQQMSSERVIQTSFPPLSDNFISFPTSSPLDSHLFTKTPPVPLRPHNSTRNPSQHISVVLSSNMSPYFHVPSNGNSSKVSSHESSSAPLSVAESKSAFQTPHTLAPGHGGNPTVV